MCDSVCRIVVEEEQTGQVQQMNAGLQKQVQQLGAALQELGREHQTLQVSGDGAGAPLTYCIICLMCYLFPKGPLPIYTVKPQERGHFGGNAFVPF